MELLTLDQAGALCGAPPNRVRQWVRDGALVMSLDAEGRRRVPADFLDETGVVKGLSGVITLLRDVGYRDEEIVEWLFREDDTLPGTPIAALRADRGTEVKRRAQASGF